MRELGKSWLSIWHDLPFFSHPNDEKEGRFHRNHSVTSMGSLRHNHNHVHDTSLPLVAQDYDTKSPEHDKEVFVYFVLIS